MGRKHIVPYGLYRAHGFISAQLAGRTGFGEEDLALLFEALENMFEHDRSAARGEMATRKLIVFKHASALGNAQAHQLFDRVCISRNLDGEAHQIDRRLDNLGPARGFNDYLVSIDRAGLFRAGLASVSSPALRVARYLKGFSKSFLSLWAKRSQKTT